MPKAKKTIDNSRSLELVYEMPDSSDLGRVVMLPINMPRISAIKILLNAEGVKFPMIIEDIPMIKLKPMPFRLIWSWFSIQNYCNFSVYNHKIEWVWLHWIARLYYSIKILDILK